MKTTYHIETVIGGEVRNQHKQSRRDIAASTFASRVYETLADYALLNRRAATRAMVAANAAYRKNVREITLEICETVVRFRRLA